MPAQVGRDHVGERHQAQARLRLGRPEGKPGAANLGQLPTLDAEATHKGDGACEENGEE